MTAATRWSLAIVGLLGANLLAMVTLAVLANRGDDRVIPSYYEQAAHYDDTQEERARSNELGWTVDVQVVAGVVLVAVRDAHGAALPGARVRVTGFHRAQAGGRFAHELEPDGAGYRGVLVERRAGVYDLTIFVGHGGRQFQRQVVVEST